MVMDSVEDGVSTAGREGVLDVDAAHNCPRVYGEVGGDGSVAGSGAVLAEAVLIGACCFFELFFQSTGYGTADYASDESSAAEDSDSNSV